MIVLASTLIPIKTVSVLNLREHWSKRASRAKVQRLTTWAELRAIRSMRLIVSAPVVVTLVRIAPRKLDSHDNLRASLKACVDGVADWLGVNDACDLIDWRYLQSKGKPGEYAVHVTVEVSGG